MDDGRQTTTGRFPAGLAGMLVLVVLIELGLSRKPQYLTEFAAYNWSYSGREAAKPRKPGAVLAIGTSLLKFGFVPAELTRQTGRPAANLSVVSGHMPSSYYLLRRAIDSGNVPAAVVVDCQDLGLTPNDGANDAEMLQVNRREWPELLTLTEGVELAWNAGDPRFLAQMVLSEALRSYRSRYEIRARLRPDDPDGKPREARVRYLLARRHWAINGGAQLMPRADGSKAVSASPAPEAEVLLPQPNAQFVRRNALTDLYAERLVHLAAEHKVAVFWVLPPLPPTKILERHATGMRALHEAHALDLMERYPNVTVISGLDASYPTRTFHDSVHLDIVGATSFTADLASIIQDRLDHPDRAAHARWVSLPPYRERAIEYPFEDFQRSIVAAQTQVYIERR